MIFLENVTKEQLLNTTQTITQKGGKMSDKKVVFVTGPAGCGKSANSQKLADFFGCKTTVDDWGAAAVAHAFKHAEGNVLVLGLPDEPDLLSGLPAGTEIEMHHYYDAAKLAGFSPFHTPNGQLLEVLSKSDAVWISETPQQTAEREKEVAKELGTYGHHLRVLNDVLSERARQESKGYDEEHDDRYTTNELARAAIVYALSGDGVKTSLGRKMYPWPEGTFKDEGRRANLIKAAALLVAEIERMDRAVAAKTIGTIDPVAMCEFCHGIGGDHATGCCRVTG